MAHPAAFPRPGQPVPQSGPKRGSKAVPLVVAAGLAAGVFTGLYFGVGTQKNESSSLPTSAAISPQEAATLVVPKDKPVEAGKPVVISGVDGQAGGAVNAGSAANVGSAANSVTPTTPDSTGSANGSASAAPLAAAEPAIIEKKPETKMVKVTFAIKPPGAEAELKVDGQSIPAEGAEFDVMAGAKKIEVTATADGFEPYKKTFSITRDDTVALNLTKKRSSSGSKSSSTKRPPSSTKKPTKKPGLIDI